MEYNVKMPCDENWDEMSLMENGRYCKTCKDKVHDLSETSIEEQEAIYNQGACVMIEIAQLAALNRTKKIKQFAIASFLIFGSSLYSSAEVFTPQPQLIQEISDSITISGIVVHKKGKKEPYEHLHLTCTVNNKEYSAYTDENGEYNFTIPSNSGKGIIKAASWRGKNYGKWSFNAENSDLKLKQRSCNYVPRFVGKF